MIFFPKISSSSDEMEGLFSFLFSSQLIFSFAFLFSLSDDDSLMRRSLASRAHADDDSDHYPVHDKAA